MVKPEFYNSIEFTSPHVFSFTPQKLTTGLLLMSRTTPTNEWQQQRRTAKKERAGTPAPEKSECAHVAGRQLWQLTLPVLGQRSCDLHLQTWLADLMLSTTLPGPDSGQLQRLLCKSLHRAEKRVCRPRRCSSKKTHALQQPLRQDHTRTLGDVSTGAVERQSSSCIYIPHIL